MNFFWVGFYLAHEEDGQLVVGPYQGPLACGRIKPGKGVCGHVWSTGVTEIVDDVHSFPGHISCSPKAKSEIVVPIKKNGKVVALLDIDSDKEADFDATDKRFLESICSEISKLYE